MGRREFMMEKINIAIDGPASAGKSTIAKILAEKLGYIYCDTGAMYRAVTYAALEAKISLESEADLRKLISKIDIHFTNEADGQHVWLNGIDVSHIIRENEVTENVSIVASQAVVRKWLVTIQQKIAISGGVVMDGRDIGTTVLPDAELKLFLNATVEERANRRHKENLEKGIPSDYEALKTAIEQRDYIDSHRTISPLQQAKDAILIDTTGRNIPEVVQCIIMIIKDKGFH